MREHGKTTSGSAWMAWITGTLTHTGHGSLEHLLIQENNLNKTSDFRVDLGESDSSLCEGRVDVCCLGGAPGAGGRCACQQSDKWRTFCNPSANNLHLLPFDFFGQGTKQKER